MAILKRIIDKEAQTIVSDVKADFKGYSKADDVNKLMDHKIYEDIRNACTTDNQIMVYFAASGNAAMKKKRAEHIIQASIYQLIKILGNEQLGLSSFIQLKQTATQLKISSNYNVKK